MKGNNKTRLWIWVVAVVIILFIFIFSMFHLPQRGKVVEEEDLVEMPAISCSSNNLQA